MNESKFTPGPWHVEPDPEWRGKHFYHEHRFITCGNNRLDSDEFEGDKNSYIIAAMRDCPNQKQDAQVIAAAPDLFDALKTFWAFYNDLAASNPGFMGKLTLQDYSQWNQALLKTERALAKAEGR